MRAIATRRTACFRHSASIEQGNGEFLELHRHTRTADVTRRAAKACRLGRARRLGVGGRRARLRAFRPRTPRGSSRPAGPRCAAVAREVTAVDSSVDRSLPPPKLCWGCSFSSRWSPHRRALRCCAHRGAARAAVGRDRDGAAVGARLDRPDSPWHAWGSRSTAALATAAVVLERPDFLVAARVEADALWTRFLLAGQIASEMAPDGTTKWFPQIAYGVSPIVEGYLALAEATKDRKYAVLAGLTAAWLAGANPAGVVMYDEWTGRTFDGIDGVAAAQVNRNAGAESTVESLLALQGVTRNADAAEYLDTGRPVNVRRRWRTFRIDESSPVPAATQSRCAGLTAGSSSWNPAAMPGRSR